MATPNQSGTDPNKGLNVKKFSIALITAVAVILVILFLLVSWKGKRLIPQTPKPRDNSSRLLLPSASGAKLQLRA